MKTMTKDMMKRHSTRTSDIFLACTYWQTSGLFLEAPAVLSRNGKKDSSLKAVTKRAKKTKQPQCQSRESEPVSLDEWKRSLGILLYCPTSYFVRPVDVN